MKEREAEEFDTHSLARSTNPSVRVSEAHATKDGPSALSVYSTKKRSSNANAM